MMEDTPQSTAAASLCVVREKGRSSDACIEFRVDEPADERGISMYCYSIYLILSGSRLQTRECTAWSFCKHHAPPCSVLNTATLFALFPSTTSTRTFAQHR
jgi:hypothetical protein